MKKAIVVAAISIVASLSLVGQKDTVVVDINGTRVEMVTNGEDLAEMLEEIQKKTREIQKVISEQNTKMSSVNRQFKEGKISKEEANTQREKIVSQTEKRLAELEAEIEIAGRSYGDAVSNKSNQPSSNSETSFEEQWLAEAGEYDSRNSGDDLANEAGESDIEWFDFDNESDDIEDLEYDWEDDFQWDKKKKNAKTTNFVFDFHGGWNFLIDGEGNTLSDNGELDYYRSNVWDLGFNWKTRLGAPGNKLYVKYGFGFSWHDWTLRGGNYLSKLDNGGDPRVAFINDPSLNIQKSEWSTCYFNIPLMFQLDLSERGMDNGFTLGVGGYGGIRLSSKSEVEYLDSFNDDVFQKTKGNLYMNSLRYGVMGQIGFNSFKITAQYDLNPLFKDGYGPLDNDGNEIAGLNNLNVTIGFSF